MSNVQPLKMSAITMVLLGVFLTIYSALYGDTLPTVLWIFYTLCGAVIVYKVLKSSQDS